MVSKLDYMPDLDSGEGEKLPFWSGMVKIFAPLFLFVFFFSLASGGSGGGLVTLLLVSVIVIFWVWFLRGIFSESEELKSSNCEAETGAGALVEFIKDVWHLSYVMRFLMIAWLVVGIGSFFDERLNLVLVYIQFATLIYAGFGLFYLMNLAGK